MAAFVVPADPDNGDDEGDEVGSESEREDLTIEERVSALEDLMAGLNAEIHTHRLVVADNDGRPRVVVETIDGVTELRLDLPGSSLGERTGLLLFAAEGQESTGYAPAIGVQLWVDGDEVATYAARRKPDGQWQTDIEADQD